MSFWAPWGTILASRDPWGHLTGYLGAQTWIFDDFGLIWGSSWDPLWGNFGDFFVIWGTKVTMWVPGWVFSDLEVEITPESDAPMCLNHQ